MSQLYTTIIMTCIYKRSPSINCCIYVREMTSAVDILYLTATRAANRLRAGTSSFFSSTGERWTRHRFSFITMCFSSLCFSRILKAISKLWTLLYGERESIAEEGDKMTYCSIASVYTSAYEWCVGVVPTHSKQLTLYSTV